VRYSGLLLLVTLVWGATFPVLKLAAHALSGLEISALRFALAALCLLPWGVRARAAAWRDGALLAALSLLAYVAQAYGLQTISSNRSAFLTSLNVLMVPLFGAALGWGMRWRSLAAALLACLGIALMSWEGGADVRADAATVGGAAAYAVFVLLLSHCAPRHSARSLAATQTLCMAALAWVWLLLGDDLATLRTLPARVDARTALGLLYLGGVASAGMLFLQARAQRHVRADQAAILYAMEPVFAACFGWLWLGEGLGLRALLGAALVLLALVGSQLPARAQPN